MVQIREPLAPSSVRPAKPVALSSVDNFLSIDARRRAAGVTVRALLAEADVDPSVWWRAAKSPDRMEARTLHKLASALDRLGAGPSPLPRWLNADILKSLLRMVMAIIAAEQGIDAREVLAHDFAKQKPLNKSWLQASRIRRAAIYVTVLEIGYDRVTVGLAIGCTRQNVKQAIDQTQRLCEEEPAMAELIARVSHLVTP